MSSNEKKYLLKQKGIWFFRMKIPAKYRHIFGVKIYKRTTGEKDLDRARSLLDNGADLLVIDTAHGIIGKFLKNITLVYRYERGHHG